MPNPLGCIIPILDLLGKELKILPATGGAVEDLQHPDQEEIEDALSCVRWAKIKDDQGELSNFLTPPLSDSKKTQAMLEGWVLGVL